MFFPESHRLTLSFQSAHGHPLGQLLLHTHIENQRRQHHQHQAGVHNAELRLGLLALHQVQQPHGEGLLSGGAAHQGHGDDVLVPEGQEVEENNGDNGGLGHGEDNPGHGLAVARAVDVGGLLKVVGEGGEVAREQINGKGQRGGGVDNRQHDKVVQKDRLGDTIRLQRLNLPCNFNTLLVHFDCINQRVDNH